MSICSKKFFNKFLFFSACFLFVSFCYHHSKSFSISPPVQKLANVVGNQTTTKKDCEHVQTQQRKIILSLEKIEDNLNIKILKE
tara:strand:+ start:943 stop:1194 length:252 start_codon:yes stop_codon:yes gene_type:complete